MITLHQQLHWERPSRNYKNIFLRIPSKCNLNTNPCRKCQGQFKIFIRISIDVSPLFGNLKIRNRLLNWLIFLLLSGNMNLLLENTTHGFEGLKNKNTNYNKGETSGLFSFDSSVGVCGWQKFISNVKIAFDCNRLVEAFTFFSVEIIYFSLFSLNLTNSSFYRTQFINRFYLWELNVKSEKVSSFNLPLFANKKKNICILWLLHFQKENFNIRTTANV